MCASRRRATSRCHWLCSRTGEPWPAPDAGVDPRFGLYSAIVVTLLASIFDSSSHLINGLTNAISLVVFSSLIGFDVRFDAAKAAESGHSVLVPPCGKPSPKAARTIC